MPKIQVDFHIKNSETIQAFKTQGILNNNKIAFFDDAADKHVLTLLNEGIHYARSGDNAIDFHFDKHQETTGVYHVGAQRINFEIVTDTLVIQKDSIYLAYTLKQSGSVVSQSELTLKYEKAQEA